MQRGCRDQGQYQIIADHVSRHVSGYGDMSPEDSTLDSCCRLVVYVVNPRDERGGMRGLDRKPGGAGPGQAPRARGRIGDASPAPKIGARSLVPATVQQ